MAMQNFGSVPGRVSAVSASAPKRKPKAMGLIQSAMQPVKAVKAVAIKKPKKGI